VDQNVWGKLWKLSVNIELVGSNNAPKDGIVEHFDVILAKLSDLVDSVKRDYPEMLRYIYLMYTCSIKMHRYIYYVYLL